MRWILAFAALSTVAVASEIKLSGPEIATNLTDVSLYAGTTVEQIFQKGGQTVYIENGGASQGLWKVQADQYCSQWPPSQGWSCFEVLQDGDQITFVSKAGKRFEMRKPK